MRIFFLYQNLKKFEKMSKGPLNEEDLTPIILPKSLISISSMTFHQIIIISWSFHITKHFIWNYLMCPTSRSDANCFDKIFGLCAKYSSPRDHYHLIKYSTLPSNFPPNLLNVIDTLMWMCNCHLVHKVLYYRYLTTKIGTKESRTLNLKNFRQSMV